jgi:hypothetical protein
MLLYFSLVDLVNRPKTMTQAPVNQPPTTVPLIKTRRHRNKAKIHRPIPFPTLP